MNYNNWLVDFLLSDERWTRSGSNLQEIDTKQKIASAIGADTTTLRKWKRNQPSLDNFVRLYELGKDYFHSLPLWIASSGHDIVYDVPEVDFRRPVFLDEDYVNRVATKTRTAIDQLSEIIREELRGGITIPVLGKLYNFSKLPVFLPVWPEYVVIQPDPIRDPKRVTLGSSYNLDADLETMKHAAPDLVVLAKWREDPRKEILFRIISSYTRKVGREKEYMKDQEQFLRILDDLNL